MLILIVAAILILFISLTSDITWYPFLQSLGFEDYWFGYLFSAIWVLGIFAPYASKYLSKKIGGHKKYLMSVLLMMVFFAFITGFINSIIFAVIIFILFMSMYDFFHPINEVLFQTFIPGKMRATILSLREMIMALVGIVSFPLVGFLADKISPQYTIFLGAFVLIPAIILYNKLENKQKQ